MKKMLPFLFLAALLPSCRRDPNFGQLSSNLVVVTNRDPTAVFTDYKTFYISDTIAYLSNTNDDTILVGPSALALVQAITTNLTNLGYVMAPKGSHPDLAINVGVVKNTSATVIYPGWWAGYPGWYPPYYYGAYYPYYYPWSIAYAVTTGTIIIDMADLKDASEDSKIMVLWNALLGGAVGSDVDTNVQAGVTAINQAFVQSPYLKTN